LVRINPAPPVAEGPNGEVYVGKPGDCTLPKGCQWLDPPFILPGAAGFSNTVLNVLGGEEKVVNALGGDQAVVTFFNGSHEQLGATTTGVVVGGLTGLLVGAAVGTFVGIGPIYGGILGLVGGMIVGGGLAFNWSSGTQGTFWDGIGTGFWAGLTGGAIAGVALPVIYSLLPLSNYAFFNPQLSYVPATWAWLTGAGTVGTGVALNPFQQTAVQVAQQIQSRNQTLVALQNARQSALDAGNQYHVRQYDLLINQLRIEIRNLSELLDDLLSH
jgi:hypothetical protein